jgi:nitronate monooxygenase
LKTFRDLGRPFWLAGSFGSAEQVSRALKAGATGVQVGTAFAFCEESGLPADLKRRVLAMSRDETTHVLTDPVASPTGFPFKVLSLPGSLSDEQCYLQRKRLCDLGYLRQAYRRDDGTIGMRCAADKEEIYLAKGGKAEETFGRKCVCNGLIATVGMGQFREQEGEEPPLVTCGDEVRNIVDFLPAEDADRYTAQDVVRKLLAGLREDAQQPTTSETARAGV